MALTTATAVINLSALKHNLAQIKLLAPTTKVLAVLKANGYGHGLERIAQALFSDQSKDTEKGDLSVKADAIAVARIDEALALRASGITQPIVLLEGFFDSKDLSILSLHNLQTVRNKPQLFPQNRHAEDCFNLKWFLTSDVALLACVIYPTESGLQPDVKPNRMCAGFRTDQREVTTQLARYH